MNLGSSLLVAVSFAAVCMHAPACTSHPLVRGAGRTEQAKADASTSAPSDASDPSDAWTGAGYAEPGGREAGPSGGADRQSSTARPDASAALDARLDIPLTPDNQPDAVIATKADVMEPDRAPAAVDGRSSGSCTVASPEDEGTDCTVGPLPNLGALPIIAKLPAAVSRERLSRTAMVRRRIQPVHPQHDHGSPGYP
jgi:hypothetical protein